MTSVPVRNQAPDLIWTQMSKLSVNPQDLTTDAGARHGREGVAMRNTLRDTSGNLSVGTIIGAAAMVVVLAVALALFPGRGAGGGEQLVSETTLQHTLADTSAASHLHDLTINAVWGERALRADAEDA